jgi:hypothetical protein
LELDITATALYRLAAHFPDCGDKLQEEITKRVKKAAEKGRVTLHTVRYILNPPHCSECRRSEEEVEAAGFVMSKPSCAAALPLCSECSENLKRLRETSKCDQCGKNGKEIALFTRKRNGKVEIICASCLDITCPSCIDDEEQTDVEDDSPAPLGAEHRAADVSRKAKAPASKMQRQTRGWAREDNDQLEHKNDELERQKAHLEEQLASAEAGHTTFDFDISGKAGVDRIARYIIDAVGDETANAVAHVILMLTKPYLDYRAGVTNVDPGQLADQPPAYTIEDAPVKNRRGRPPKKKPEA